VARLGVLLPSGSTRISPDQSLAWFTTDTLNVSDTHGDDVSVLTFLQSNWAKALHPPMEKVRGEQRPPHRPRTSFRS